MNTSLKMGTSVTYTKNMYYLGSPVEKAQEPPGWQKGN